MGNKTKEYKLLMIPRRRRRDMQWIIFYIFGILIYFAALTLFIEFNYSTGEEKINRIAYFATCFIYALIAVSLGEILARLGLLISEQRYLSTRYNGQSMKLCRRVYFQYGLRFWIVLVVCAGVLVSIHFGYRKESVLLTVIKAQWFMYVTWIIIRGTLIPLFCLDGLTPSEASTVPDSAVMNCGQGLAWNYYLDYLKIILPDLPDRISNTEWFHSDKGKMVTKLFLLMPEDCAAPPTLNKLDPLVTFKGTTQPIYANRCGSIQKPFTNSIYAIENPEKGKLFYAAVEFASPLHCLYEMSETKEAHLTKGQMREQMYIFYRTLTKILEKSPHSCNVVLLPYREKTPDGEKFELSKYLCSAIGEEHRLYGEEWIF